MGSQPVRPSETAPPVVLIAGASSGIGLQTALCYAERGARLVLAARSLGALQDAEEQCLQAGAAATLVAVTDVVGPLMRVTGLSRQRIDPHPGTVLEPRPGPRGPAVAQPPLISSTTCAEVPVSQFDSETDETGTAKRTARRVTRPRRSP